MRAVMLVLCVMSFFLSGTAPTSLPAQPAAVSAVSSAPETAPRPPERAPSGYDAVDHGTWSWAAPERSAPPHERLVSLITDKLTRIRSLLGRSGSITPLVVRTPNRSEFRRVTIEYGGGDPENYVTALAFPARGVVVLDQTRLDALPLTRGEVIAHELAHVVLGEAGPTIPRWYHEGVAQWVAGERLEAQWLRLLAFLAHEKGLYPFEELDRFMVESQRESSVMYAQSHHFVLFLNGRFGPAVHGEILDRLERGETFAPAIEAVTGVPLEQVEEDWAKELEVRHRWWNFAVGGLTLFQLLAGLAVVAFFVQRTRRRRMLRRMEEAEEEEAAASLSAALAARGFRPSAPPEGESRR